VIRVEVAVVGSADFVTGFLLAGVRKTFITTDADLEPTLKEVLKEEDIGILIMNSDDVEKLSAPLRIALDDSVEPTVISIGGAADERTHLREKIRRSVGVDLWK
jgi:V/A-type H+/Na+-transporting ATPase subunit F